MSQAYPILVRNIPPRPLDAALPLPRSLNRSCKELTTSLGDDNSVTYGNTLRWPKGQGSLERTEALYKLIMQGPDSTLQRAVKGTANEGGAGALQYDTAEVGPTPLRIDIL